MANQEQLQKKFHNSGFSDFKWIDPKEIVVAQWVRMKCMYGCENYGRNASCPPNTPSLAECRSLFDSYKLGALFKFTAKFVDPDERHEWAKGVNRQLVELEKEISTSGYYKSFMLFVENCKLCRDCTNTRAACRNKKIARPSMEALGIDVLNTVSKYGYSINLLPDEKQEMNRYAVILIE